MARIVKRRLEMAYQKSKDAKVDILQFKEETDFIKFGIKNDANSDEKEVRVAFMNEEYNTKDILRACKDRSLEI